MARRTVASVRRGTVGRRVAGRACWAAASIVSCMALCTGLAVSTPGVSGAAPSGWYTATVPGTGADDLLLGTTCVSGAECWAVGVSIVGLGNGSSTTSFTPLVEQWNGSSWTLEVTPSLPAGDGGGIFNVSCVGPADCWGVGTLLDEASTSGNPTGTLVEHWDGTSWSYVPSPNPAGTGVAGAFLEGVSCSSVDSCMAVGYATDSSGNNLTDVAEQWNGTAWSIVPTPATGQTYDQLTGVQCLSAADCWAVGNAGPAQQNGNFLPIFPGQAPGDQGLTEHWDGSSWSIVPSVTEPSPDGGYLNGLDCVSDTDCWASGSVTDATGYASTILLEQWNGTSWVDVSSSVPSPSSGPSTILSSISCLGASQCWAVGSTGVLGNNGGGSGSNFLPQPFVENWNGSSWSIDPSPDVAPFAYLNSVSCLAQSGCTAAGSTATTLSGNDPGFRALVEQMDLPPSSSQGLVLGAGDGGVFTYGTAAFAGSMGGQHLNAPIVGVADTPDGGGYWLVASDGGVFSFGDARFYGSMGGQHLNAPIVGVADTPDGGGYWLVASDGGVFSFGDALYYGSMGGQHLNAPVVGMAAGGPGGYWLVASDGGVFSFGDAAFYGSAGSLHLVAAVAGMAATPDGQGYWLVGRDGGVFTYGNAPYEGSAPGQGIAGQPAVVGIARTPSGQGYWLAGSNGAVYAYGDAAFLGSPQGHPLAAPVVGLAAA